MKKTASIFITLTIVSLLWANGINQNSISSTQRTIIEKEILKVHERMKDAAETFNAEALYEYVLDSNDVIIENGLLRQNREEAFEITKQQQVSWDKL